MKCVKTQRGCLKLKKQHKNIKNQKRLTFWPSCIITVLLPQQCFQEIKRMMTVLGTDGLFLICTQNYIFILT
jgi:hypothetical protein